MISSTSTKHGDKRKNDSNNNIIKKRKNKKDTNADLAATVTDKLNSNIFNISFALWNELQKTDIKSFTLNVDTGLLQYITTDGVLNVRSTSSDLCNILRLKADEISIPYNFSRVGSESQKAEDLRIKVEFFDKPVKQLNIAAELVAKDIYQLLQCIEKLPDNPPARDSLIFNHSEDYRIHLIRYLNSIKDKDEFFTFNGALEVTTEDFLSEQQLSVETLNVPEGYSLQTLLSVNESERPSRLKVAIDNLSTHVWNSINSLVKDAVSQEVIRRRQLRYLVTMVQAYRTLELLCALKPRKQGQTIKSQVTKKIMKKSNGRLKEKDLTLNIQRGFRIERTLNAIGARWNILDAFDNLTPCFFTSTINGCLNFEIWIEIVMSNEVISYSEAENRYRQFKMNSAYERVRNIKQACEKNAVEVQLQESDFNIEY